MRILGILLMTAAAAAPLVVHADELPPSDFGLAFSASSTTGVSTFADPTNIANVAGNIVTQHAKGTAGHAADATASTYTVTTDDGFYFKQGVKIEGNGSAQSTTTLSLTFTNTQAFAQDIRFDSFIIPGHFGVRQVGADTLQAEINFQVALSGEANPLFVAQYVMSNNPQAGTDMGSQFGSYVTNTNNGLLNGASSFRSTYYGAASGQYNFDNAHDWWDHRFYLDLGLFQPGESKVVTYASTVSASIAGATCADLADVGTGIGFGSTCSAVDVSFGDPTKNGGVVGRPVAALAGQAQPGSPIIGYADDPFFVDLRAYQTNRPEHPQDTPPFTPNYNPGAGPSVPEPSSWAMMIAGFVMTGLASSAASRKRSRTFRSA